MREHPGMPKLMLATALTVAGIGLVACGSGSGGSTRTVTVTSTATSAQQTPTSAPAGGDAILIETRITNAMQHTGKVVGVWIGESAYCRGGRSSGTSAGP